MKVQIIEHDTGALIGEFPIVYKLIDSNPTEKDYQDIAWDCAVEDGLVKNENRKKYRFLICKE